MLVCPLCRIALRANESVCPRDGQAGREALLHVVTPEVAKRFHVVEPFAHGAVGSLYLADEPETGRRGLLKVLAPLPRNLLPERQRVRRELVKQATMQSANLVTPYGAGESDGQFWLFREWIDGVSLGVRLAREGALPTAQALSIAAQLAVALDELHRAGLLQRDLKPGHVLLEAGSGELTRVRLIDAGLCSAVEGQPDSLLLGTPGYLAPEQLSGKLVSFRSDLYALGCVLYEMLTGQPVFPGADEASVLAAQRKAEMPAIPKDLPEGIAPLLRSLLAQDPQERPFSAQKLRRTLDAFLPDGAAVTRPPTKTFANVPDPRNPVPREPNGTVRPPPAPPSASAAPPPSVRASAPPPPPPTSSSKATQDRTQLLEPQQILEAALVRPRPSAPPPPPPRASVPPAARASAPPPPPPARPSAPPAGAGRSVPPPPPPGKSRVSADPTEAIDFAEVLSEESDADSDLTLAEKQEAARPGADHTQPIRLEQVLAVAESRARVSAPRPPRSNWAQSS